MLRRAPRRTVWLKVSPGALDSLHRGLWIAFTDPHNFCSCTNTTPLRPKNFCMRIRIQWIWIRNTGTREATYGWRYGICITVLWIGIRCFLILGSGTGIRDRKNSGSGMNILDYYSESLETVLGLKILKFFDADLDPGAGIFLSRVRDEKIRIRDPK